MSLISCENTSCVFNTFIQSLPSVWSLPSTLEGAKNHNSAETQQRANISPKFMPEQLLAHYWQTI
jgi:hypothetical protein